MPRARTVVVGLGRSGLSALTHLGAHGISSAVVDSRDQPPALTQAYAAFPDLEVHLGDFDPHYLAAALELVVSPGIGLDDPAIAHAIEQGVPAYGDVELFARVARRPVVAITGSNGKSTVTTLVGEMAKANGNKVAVGGNLGPPALDLLPPPPWLRDRSGPLGAIDEPELYVLELSSFQLETTSSLSPAVAVVLNLSPDHMDRYRHLDAYVAAKLRVFDGAQVAIVNRDDPLVAACGVALEARGLEVIGFTVGEPAVGDYGFSSDGADTWLTRGAATGVEWVLPVSAMSLVGHHNRVNALTALAIADAMGFGRSATVEALKRFQGLAHRCELISVSGGVRWINDSKGTNVGATVAAIAGLSELGPLVLIAGGDGKGADFGPLASALKGKARAVVLIGRDGPRIGEVLGDIAPLFKAQDMDEAVGYAAAHSRPGDVVVLSPACASWDMYSGYAARGAHFAAAVRARDIHPRTQPDGVGG